MDKIKSDIEKLISYGNVGFYKFCEVIQVVLLNKQNKKAINYFTHIEFSSKYSFSKKFEFLTVKPISINDTYKVAISKSIITIDEFREVYFSAIDSGKWQFKNITVDLDDVFPTGKKYIPGNDPTGGQYGLVVPIEYSLYGSNFIGNYYLHELFSKKKVLSNINMKSMKSIRSVIKECKLNYNIERLRDRIGNVVCKFNIEVIKATPVRLGATNGIELNLNFNTQYSKKHRYSLQVLQEHDGIIYDNILIENFDCKKVVIEPNQCKNTIIVLDNDTGLICFSEVYDYTCKSNYHSQVTPPYVVAQGGHKIRKLLINEKNVDIVLNNVEMMGDVYFFIEMEMTNLRKQQWEDEYFKEQNYFISYTTMQHEKALSDIRKIINGKLLWDLLEICIIDPYLSANDILNTVVYSEKEGIIVKCLCDFSALHGNSETKENCSAVDFTTFKQVSNELLSKALSYAKDLNIEYRSVYDGFGTKFHDRFLILKYRLNKSRVWSLGASVNSIGSKHTIIQIVEAPEIITSLFDELWENTSNDKCQIYKQGIITGKKGI